MIGQSVVYCFILNSINVFKVMAIYLSKQQALDTDPKAIQQINFAAKLDEAWKKKQYFSLLKKQKELFRLFQKKLWKYCEFVLI